MSAEVGQSNLEGSDEGDTKNFKVKKTMSWCTVTGKDQLGYWEDSDKGKKGKGIYT